MGLPPMCEEPSPPHNLSKRTWSDHPLQEYTPYLDGIRDKHGGDSCNPSVIAGSTPPEPINKCKECPKRTFVFIAFIIVVSQYSSISSSIKVVHAQVNFVSRQSRCHIHVPTGPDNFFSGLLGTTFSLYGTGRLLQFSSQSRYLIATQPNVVFFLIDPLSGRSLSSPWTPGTLGT